MAPKRKVRIHISLGKKLMQCSELENAFKQKEIEAGGGGRLQRNLKEKGSCDVKRM